MKQLINKWPSYLLKCLVIEYKCFISTCIENLQAYIQNKCIFLCLIQFKLIPIGLTFCKQIYINEKTLKYVIKNTKCLVKFLKQKP